MNAQQTPLIDLLKNVPRTARLLVEENHSTTSIPVGKLCADAIEELERAQALAMEPITDEKLQEIIKQHITISDTHLLAAVYMICRDVEAAHGIFEGEK